MGFDGSERLVEILSFGGFQYMKIASKSGLVSLIQAAWRKSYGIVLLISPSSIETTVQKASYF